MYDDDNADIEIAANDDAATSDDANDGDTAAAAGNNTADADETADAANDVADTRMTIRTWWRITRESEGNARFEFFR